METPPSFLARPKLLDRADEIIRSLSSSGKVLYYALAALILGSATGILLMVNSSIQVSLPERGATLSEGIIGGPRFVNPVLAITDADRDMTALVYSGLLKAAPSGELIPDLADTYTVSPDGRTHTLHIRDGATFQDGTPVTADDVAYTIQKITDPAIKSPHRANWQGVVVTVVDPQTISFGLAAPYAPFADNLTIGIIPKHLWQKIPAQEWAFSSLNTSPIGSGPYRVAGIKRTPAGSVTSYDLRSFANYALGEPYLSRMIVRFYDNERTLIAALEDGSVDAGSGISPSSVPALHGAAILSAPLNRIFGVFFNQNNNVALQDAGVRQALSIAVDRPALVDTALGGYAKSVETPVPPALHKQFGVATSSDGRSPEDRIAEARQKLETAGWYRGGDGTLQKRNNGATTSLQFTITTGNVPELRAVADMLATTWRKLGAVVNVEVFEQGDLAENSIRPRKYEALLFGEVVKRGLDLFAFWDSSQRNDPGLNIAMYANTEADAVLGKLRSSTDDAERQQLYERFEAIVAEDNPAVFLYAPDFIYIVPSDLQGVELGSIENQSDRFDTVRQWYRSTDRVWKVFANKTAR